jgi:hypothetical protein
MAVAVATVALAALAATALRTTAGLKRGTGTGGGRHVIGPGRTTDDAVRTITAARTTDDVVRTTAARRRADAERATSVADPERWNHRAASAKADALPCWNWNAGFGRRNSSSSDGFRRSKPRFGR